MHLAPIRPYYITLRSDIMYVSMHPLQVYKHVYRTHAFVPMLAAQHVPAQEF